MAEPIHLTEQQAEFVIRSLLAGAEVTESLLAACTEHRGLVTRVLVEYMALV